MLTFTFSNLTGFFFAFIPALFSIGLVIYILTSLPRNRLSDIFALLTLCGGLWQLDDATARISANKVTADALDSIFCAGWIFIGALSLHFSLLYCKFVSDRILPWAVGILYFPSFLFLAIYQGHFYTHEFRYSNFWGWINYHDTVIADKLIITWVCALVVCACILLFYFSYQIRKDKLLFSQAILIAIGLAIPATGGITTQFIFPILLHISAIPVTSYFLTFLGIATVIALNRYRLFTVSELISNDLLLDDLPVTVISVSDTGNVTYVNKYGTRLLDIKKDMLRQTRFNKLMTYALPEHERNFSIAYNRALKGQYLDNVESSLIVGDKTLNMIVSASPIINNNRIRGVLFCIRDVTDLKTSLRLTERSVSSLKDAQKISHIGSLEWVVTKNKISWSDELYRIYGLQPGKAQLRYETFAAFNHPDDMQMVRDQFQIALEGHLPVNFTYRILAKDGTIKFLHARLQVIDETAENPAKLIGTVQDITQQVQTESSLQQKNAELMRSNANLEEFLFVASHDLKEPVRKIITFADLILTTEKETLSEKGRSHFERMISAARRIQNMIADLLSLSLIGQDHTYQSCDLQAIVREVMEDLDLKIKEMKAVVEFANLPTVYVNHTQFRQLFLNLISNSLKFAKKDVPPAIKISSRPLKLKEVDQLSVFKGMSYIKITFQDNGIGFENMYSDKIFQLFQRLHGKVDYEGTGIGLAVCKKIVENHKGIITASGAPGVGATFTIIIPVAPEPALAGELP
jgi:PAS domain S-box-containing protein